MHHPVKNIAPPTTQKGPDDVFFVVECQINNRTAPPPAIRDIALMSGGILCKGVVLKVHRVINYNSMYIIIGYDINTPLMTMYEIMTLCKHRMVKPAGHPKSEKSDHFISPAFPHIHSS